jgi:phosphatidylinositol dimannoside acyltransferase
MTDRTSGRIAGRLVDAAYAAGWALVKRMPERVARTVFALIADLVWRRRGPAVRQLEANLARVVGAGASPARLRELSRAAMRSYLRYWMEAFRLPVWSADRVVGTFGIENEHLMRDPLAAGRGVVVALPHSANWDHAGAWAVLTGAPLTTVAERLRPESLFDRFVEYRKSLGMEVLPLGDVHVAGVLARRLRAGRLVCLLGDRDLTASGVEVRFFGEPAKMPAGPAVLALQTGAALVPVSLWYTPGGVRGRFHPEVTPPEGAGRPEQVAAMTQAVADAFAEGIAEHPQDWHMLQRLWLADLPARQPGAGSDAGSDAGPGAGPERART